MRSGFTGSLTAVPARIRCLLPILLAACVCAGAILPSPARADEHDDEAPEAEWLEPDAAAEAPETEWPKVTEPGEVPPDEWVDLDAPASLPDSATVPMADPSAAAPAIREPGWRRSRHRFDAPAMDRRVVTASSVDNSVEPVLRDLLEWEFGLRSIPSGGYHLPDQIYSGDLPGREAPSPIVEGISQAMPGYTELPPDGIGLTWMSRGTLRPPDPLTLPSNPTAGPILEVDLVDPGVSPAVSGVRFTSASNRTHTEEAFLARQAGDLLLRVFYQDSKSDGRYGYYGKQGGENLHFRVDGGSSRVGWRFGWQRQVNRARLIERRRYVWHRSGWDGGLALQTMGWKADLAMSTVREQHEWEAVSPILRRDALERALLRLQGPGESLRPMATVQIDRGRLTAHRPVHIGSAEFLVDDRSVGVGLAAGVDGVSKGWRFRASAGRSAPAMNRSGWVAALDVRRSLGSEWSLAMHADRAVRAPLMPRLADDLGILVGQGLTAPVVDPDRPLEVLLRGSSRLSRKLGERGSLHLEGRVQEIRHTVSGADGALLHFRSAGHPWFPEDALDMTVRSVAVQGGGTLDLLRGFSVTGDVVGRWSDPSWKSHLWMSPWEGRARLDWRARLFKGDLWLNLFIRGVFAGQRATPVRDAASAQSGETVILAPGDRYDAGGTARVGDMTLFFMLLNLEDDVREAAAYEAGWITLPFRSFRMGMTWHFLD